MLYFITIFFKMEPQLTLHTYGQLHSPDTDIVQRSDDMSCQQHLLNHTDKLKEREDKIKQFTERE